MRKFESPGAFAKFLGRMGAELPEARKKGLEAGAKVLVAEIRMEMGTYPDGADWQQLAERTQTSRENRGYEPNEPLLVTGHLMETVASVIHADHAEVGSPDPIMKYQEFGTPDAAHPIPPRPVIGGSLFRKEKEIVKALVEPTIKVLRGD